MSSFEERMCWCDECNGEIDPETVHCDNCRVVFTLKDGVEEGDKRFCSNDCNKKPSDKSALL